MSSTSTSTSGNRENGKSGLRIGFVSLGCPKNLVDGEVMLGMARDAGYELTADAKDADVIVVNTCAFIDTAKEESVDAILEMAQLKRNGRCRRLVVTGCLGERYREELQAEIPEVDVVLGTGDVPFIVDAVEGRPVTVPLYRSRDEATGERTAPHAAQRTARHEAQAPEHVPAAPTYLYDASTPRLRTTPRHFAYVKVGEGCDYTCAFCIIPTLRGAYRSRTEDSIVAEAEALVASGVRELLLISQDTTFFGNDRGTRGGLARLLRRLDRIEGLSWVRLLYLYPTTITDEVLDAIGESASVCRYIDLPLQHASADVLRRMRRPGNRDAYTRLLSRIRKRLPDVTLRTTFIVGFPGETGADYRELRDFVQEIEFDHVGVFTYSHEEGTRAWEMEDDVSRERKDARRGELMFTQQGIVAAKLRARIGTTEAVIIDGPSPDSPLVLQGRTRGQAPEIDSVVYLSEADPEHLRAGDVIQARIVGAHAYDLIAEPLAVEAPERPRAARPPRTGTPAPEGGAPGAGNTVPSAR